MSLPEFSDYRRTDDGVMIADVGFKKQLWVLDPELDVVWDWGSTKWEIWKFPGQGRRKRKRVDQLAYHVTTVQTKGRTFRELGADILLKLQAGDMTKYSLKELVAYFDKMDDNLQREKRRKLRDSIESRSREAAWYLHGNPYRVLIPRRFMEGTKFLLDGPSPEVKTTRVLGGADA